MNQPPGFPPSPPDGNFAPPVPGYGAPGPEQPGAYGQPQGAPPQQGYGAPQQAQAGSQGYGNPQQGHVAPPHGYVAPPQGYGGPPQGHGGPPQGYGGPYGPPPAQGFGAGYVPPLIQPPQALEQPSTLHKVGGGIIALSSALLIGLGAAIDSGPYYWLSAIQAEMFGGEYYPALSFLLAWMILLFTLLPIWLGIVSAIEGRNAFRVAFKNAMNSFGR